MPYLIDGHNLIGQLKDLSLSDPNDEAILVTRLKAFCARTKKKATVIFDRGIVGGKSSLSNSTVQVHFVATPREADDLMIKYIQNNIKNHADWTCVSSDERVLRVAKQKGMQIIRSKDFAEGHLNRPIAPPRSTKDGNVPMSKRELDEWLNLFGEDQ
ncbi:MAG: NYN domain-containing protein [Phototrophicaceae bacterium]